MARIGRIKKGGDTTYPVTITQAVVDLESGMSLDDELNEIIDSVSDRYTKNETDARYQAKGSQLLPIIAINDNKEMIVTSDYIFAIADGNLIMTY